MGKKNFELGGAGSLIKPIRRESCQRVVTRMGGAIQPKGGAGLKTYDDPRGIKVPRLIKEGEGKKRGAFSFLKRTRGG